MTMRDVIRVVLVDPSEDSRVALQKLLGTITSLWVVEVFASYQSVAARIAEIAPDLCLIALDSDPHQAVDLISGLHHLKSEAVLLPASTTCDPALILKAIRAGARELLTLPTEASELHDIVLRLFSGRDEGQVASVRGPQTITITGAAG